MERPPVEATTGLRASLSSAEEAGGELDLVVAEAELPALFAAALEASWEATLNAIVAAAADPPSHLRDGTPLPALPLTGWPPTVARRQRHRG